MSTAEELERHAAAARAARQAIQEQDELVHRRMQQAANFFGEFAKQMNVIAPRARQVMDLPGVMRFAELVIRDLFVEERMRQAYDPSATISGSAQVRYEYLLLSYHYFGPRRHTLVRDLAPEIERLEDQLSMNRIRYEVKLLRNARAQVERASFHVESNIAAGVKFIPDYDQGRVRIALRNIDRLATWEVTIAASELSQPLFEELAKCVLGHANEFRRLALGDHRSGAATTPRAPPLGPNY